MIDTVFARMLLIMLVSVVAPEASAVLIQGHRLPSLETLVLLLPSVAFGVYFAARGITRPLARITAGARSLGRGAESRGVEGSASPAGPRELRELSAELDLAQNRVQSYVTNRSRVLAAVSHDLKAPLTRMRLRVETLSDEITREKLERDLDELSGLVRTAIAMLKDLENPESLEAIDMNLLVARLQSEYAEMGSSVAVVGRAGQPYIGRLQSLKRCLTNLIDNAVKFGENASVTLEDGHALRVRVTDGGPGIPQDELDRVFEPFYRARAALSRGVEGTGLGLSIAHDIVLGHGGQLHLRNREARGLEAEVVLPRG